MFRSAICRLPLRSKPLGLGLTAPLLLSWPIYHSNHHCWPARRTFSVVHQKHNSSTSTTQTSTEFGKDSESLDPIDPNLVYNAPLTSTFRRLKIFSLASFSLSCSLAPLIFIIESQLPFFARTCLAGLAVGTSGVSTGLIAWVGRPYVTTLRRIDSNDGGAMGLEFTTANWRLQTRITRVYDTSFLTNTDRPFAKWQLDDELVLPSSTTPSSTPYARPNSEETVAETFDRYGNVLGSWVVTWGSQKSESGKEENIVGKCRAVGHVIKHFQVHEELFEVQS
ncbi:uncharacterized protein C8R40DRAFT_1104240 [Lentinula edodes]|uniref:uncharacterized protein n=1 Tax=Lentinula edodes TaxID=5353 RepID=UPI001E8E636C|nr:uncharacterized protein C8R40DRAFT_1104240 [Lentinula edodes]KAH7875456.1 hypothetical protein C8R40DRAFT_1104240 [Lentinula edodes]KAJ3914679.1 hypothetical protein F5877DRAFT_82559 [Lentinula edodes]